MNPILNMGDLEYVSDGPDLPGLSAPVASKIGAKKLGYNVSICPPGKSTCPFHNHRIVEEMFLVLEGEGKLRFGNETFKIKKGDFIACPSGGREVAHQIIKTNLIDLKYLALSTVTEEEICEYPDSNKIGVYAGLDTKKEMRKIFISDTNVPYYQGEDSDCLKIADTFASAMLK